MRDDLHRRPPSELDLDPRREGWFQEWLRMGLVQRMIGFDEYCQHRADGTWNARAERHWPGRDEFKVEEEGDG